MSWIEWLLWAVAIGCIILIVITFFIIIEDIKEKKQVKRQALKNKKEQEIIETVEKQKRESDKAFKVLKEQVERGLNQHHKEKLKAVSLLQQKNQQTRQEIESLRYIVSGLSIFDDDFLEQQPKILEYINEVIDEGRA